MSETTHRAYFGDRERAFRLTPAMIRRLEADTGQGIGGFTLRFQNREFHHDHMVAVIRLALIGGGMSDKEANSLVRDFAYERPIVHVWPLAADILMQLWGGAPLPAIDDESEAEPEQEITPEIEAAIANSLAAVKANFSAAINEAVAAVEADFSAASTDPVVQAAVEGDFSAAITEAAAAPEPAEPSFPIFGKFTSGAWLEYIRDAHPDLLKSMERKALLALRDDALYAADANAWNANRNSRLLKLAGLKATFPNLAIMHEVGSDAGVKIIRAHSATPIANVLSDDFLAVHPQHAGQSVGQFIQSFHDRFPEVQS